MEYTYIPTGIKRKLVRFVWIADFLSTLLLSK
jgi:hypothetical protein